MLNMMRHNNMMEEQRRASRRRRMELSKRRKEEENKEQWNILIVNIPIYNESHYTVYERHHLIFGKTNELTE